MSYDQMNIGGRCAPGAVACPTPMAMPSYTQACAPKIPMPIYQQEVLPQQQFGIVGGSSCYTPPPAVSYAPHYVCYNAGHQSYNQTLGTLSNIIIGAIYSTPMNGGNTPGQLATQGGSNPYAAYCPPGQDPNKYYEQQCLTNPPSFVPQPQPCNVGRGGCATPAPYTPCDPYTPRPILAYDSIFKPLPKVIDDCGSAPAVICKSEQWDSSVANGKGTLKISDRYEIKLNEGNSEWVLFDKNENKTTTIWGDPHLNTSANGNLQFKETMTFVLEDGTKITAKTTPFKGGDGTETLTSELYITNGNKSMKVSGLAKDSDAATPDGALSVVTSLTNGVAVDKMINDGANTVYQVGDLWVNAATGKQITQAQIESAEACYTEEDTSAYKGSDKRDDDVKGSNNNDRYIATKGDDEFDGGAGVDTAVFSGDIEDYKVEPLSNNRIKVTDENGNTTILKNVEKLEFNGKIYTTFFGTSSNETSLSDGNETREIVFSFSGDDQIHLSDASKTKYFDGGTGTDTINLSGKKEDYEFDDGEDGNIVISDADTGKVLAVVSNTERVSFADAKDVDIKTLL